MKRLVVFDSFFGNTEKIAQAIGSALGAKALRVADVKQEDLVDLDLLVVGSPTRAFRPTPTIVALLNSIPANGLKGVKATAFDTRIDPSSIKKPFLRVFLNILVSIFGYAACPLSKLLENKGANIVSQPEGFMVDDTEGPLQKGELERAKEWAAVIGEK